MKLSELIEQYIKEMLEEHDNYIEIQRNELAGLFNCVPSQINYVITTRFSPENGYYVESKRGGGGNIKIKRVDITKDKYIMHIINSIGDNLSQQEVDILIGNFLSNDVINELEAKLLKVATSDKVLQLPMEFKDEVRTRIFKNMLINLV